MASWLQQEQISLAFTTYQTNRLFLVGLTPDGKLAAFDREFDRPMGLFANSDRLFLTNRYQLWQFDGISPSLVTASTADRIYIPRLSYITGDVNAHEIAEAKNLWNYDNIDCRELVFVNTLFSCLATLYPQHSFHPIWKPPFISKLAAEDRCHLNGLALENGKPRYVTACSSSDTAAGWRSHRDNGGVVIDVESNEIVCTGFSMPHSPRIYDRKLWLLNAGSGDFGYVELDTGKFQTVTFCPGFVRGLAFYKKYAIIGLSQPRHGNFQGLALDDRLEATGQQAQCGLMVVDLTTGNILHSLIFEDGVKELFDIVILPGVRQPIAIGFDTDEIERFVTFTGSNGILSTRPGIHNTQFTLVKVSQPVTPSETAVAHFNQGRQLQKQGLLEEAADCFNQAIALQPDYIAAYNNLGNILQRQGKIPEAIAILSRAVEIDPNAAVTHCNLASAQLLAGNMAAAKAGYQRSLRLDSNFYLAHLNLGKLHASQGEKAIAEAYYRSVLRLQPDNAEARGAIAHITQQPSHNPVIRGDRDIALPQSSVKYQAIYHLSAANTIDYDAFTFPSIKERWQTHSQLGELFGFSAAVDGQMVGMAIADMLPETQIAELISLLVLPNFRHQKIGQTLVKYLEKSLTESGCRTIIVKYQVTPLTQTALEPLLDRLQWQPPESKFLLAKTTIEKLSQAPWLYKYPLPEAFEIFPWAALTQTEKQLLLTRKDYPDALSPFSNDTRIEPLNSLGLRYKGEVIGWCLTHRVAPDTIRYSSFFVAKQYQKMGRGISLLAEAIKRQIASPVANVKFSVATDNAPMLQFFNRHLRPYVTGIGESRIAVKLLRE